MSATACRTIRRICCSFGLGCFAVISTARAQVADLSIENVPNQVIVTPMRAQTVRLVVRNLGPDPVPDARAGLGRRVDPSTLVVTHDPNCSITTDVTAEGILYLWNVGALGAGATAFCDFTFRATPASPTDVVSFQNPVFQAGNTDPDGFNSFALLQVARSALDRPTDITITAQRFPGGLQPPGTTQRVELTIRNLGPGTPDRIAIVSPTYFFAFPLATGYRGYDIFPRPDTFPCSYFRDEFFPAAQIQLTLGTPLPVGSSVQCSVDVLALKQTPVSSTLEWNAFVRGAGVYDTDQSNNVAVLQIPFQAPQPVPLSALAWVMLGLLIGATTWVRARRAPA